jgi:hypothetical protein
MKCSEPLDAGALVQGDKAQSARQVDRHDGQIAPCFRSATVPKLLDATLPPAFPAADTVQVSRGRRLDDQLHAMAVGESGPLDRDLAVLVRALTAVSCRVPALCRVSVLSTAGRRSAAACKQHAQQPNQGEVLQKSQQQYHDKTARRTRAAKRSRSCFADQQTFTRCIAQHPSTGSTLAKPETNSRRRPLHRSLPSLFFVLDLCGHPEGCAHSPSKCILRKCSWHSARRLSSWVLTFI